MIVFREIKVKTTCIFSTLHDVIREKETFVAFQQVDWPKSNTPPQRADGTMAARGRFLLQSTGICERYFRCPRGCRTGGRLNPNRGLHINTCTHGNSYGFLFDIDGVIVRGKKLLPSAKEAFDLLTDGHGNFTVPALFVTNAGNTMRQNKAKQLSDWLGIHVSEEQVVMSHSPLRMFTQFHDKHCLISGQGPLLEIARNLGFTRVTTVETLRDCYPHLDMVDHNKRRVAPCAFRNYTPKFEAVILFGEPVRWETNLQLIIDVLITEGYPNSSIKEISYPHLPVLACNMDLLWMSEANLPRFGHGCFLHSLESLYQKITGRELKYTALIGKPSEITYHHADYQLRQQAKALGMKGISTIYCIGDNPETDIYGANLYNRYLQKRSLSLKKRSAKQVVQQNKKIASQQGSTNTTTTRTESSRVEDEEEESDEEEILSLQHEFLPDGPTQPEEFTQHCESILVCTGVFSSDRDYVTFRGTRPSNHNHRDFVIDHDLKQPRFVTSNILEAVRLAVDRQQSS